MRSVGEPRRIQWEGPVRVPVAFAQVPASTRTCTATSPLAAEAVPEIVTGPERNEPEVGDWTCTAIGSEPSGAGVQKRGSSRTATFPMVPVAFTCQTE